LGQVRGPIWVLLTFVRCASAKGGSPCTAALVRRTISDHIRDQKLEEALKPSPVALAINKYGDKLETKR